MNTITSLTLQPGRTLRLRFAKGMRLSVQCGRIWLTQTDSLDDHFVDAGGTVELPSHGLALVTTEPLDGRAATAQLRLEFPRAMHPAWRLRLATGAASMALVAPRLSTA